MGFFSKTVCAVCSWCFFGVGNDCLNDYMWEFAKVSGPRGKKANTQKLSFPLREKTMRGCAELAATGGTRRAHHFINVKEILLVPDSNSLRFNISLMGVFQVQSLSINLLLMFTHECVKGFHFVFLLHEFRSRFSKQMISVAIQKRFRNICRVRESDERFTTTQNLLMSSGNFVSIGQCVLIQPVLACKHCDRFPCTCRILR